MRQQSLLVGCLQQGVEVKDVRTWGPSQSWRPGKVWEEGRKAAGLLIEGVGLAICISNELTPQVIGEILSCHIPALEAE